MENQDILMLVAGAGVAALAFFMGDKQKAWEALANLKNILNRKKDEPAPVPTPVEPVPEVPLLPDEKVDPDNLWVELYFRLKDGISGPDVVWLASRAFAIFWMLKPFLIPLLFAKLPKDIQAKESLPPSPPAV